MEGEKRELREVIERMREEIERKRERGSEVLQDSVQTRLYLHVKTMFYVVLKRIPVCVFEYSHVKRMNSRE